MSLGFSYFYHNHPTIKAIRGGMYLREGYFYLFSVKNNPSKKLNEYSDEQNDIDLVDLLLEIEL